MDKFVVSLAVGGAFLVGSAPASARDVLPQSVSFSAQQAAAVQPLVPAHRVVRKKADFLGASGLVPLGLIVAVTATVIAVAVTSSDSSSTPQ